MKSRTYRKLSGNLLRNILIAAGLVLSLAATAQQAPKLSPGTYSVDELLREVSSSAGYRFAVNSEFDRTRMVALTKMPTSVNEVLDLAVANSGYKYDIRDRYVMIKVDPDYKTESPAPAWKIDPWGPKIYYFPIDKTTLMRDFSSNGRMLDGLDALLRDPDVWPRIDSVIITAAASPIASQQYNAKLAINRAEQLATYIRWQHPQVDRTRISTFPLGIDWDGFWALIENTPGVPSREEILRLRGLEEHTVLEMLRRVGGRQTYDYLLKKIYPKLQYSAVRVVLDDGRSIPTAGSPLRRMIEPKEVLYDTVWVERVVRDTVRIIEHVPTPAPPTVTITVVEPSIEEPTGKPFYIALKNNLLFDAALLPNIAIEIPFGRNYGWSAEVEGHWSWWNTEQAGKRSWWYHRIQMAGFELRHWLGNRTNHDPLHGWYIGAYGYAGTYDVRLFTDDNPDLGQLSDMSWSAGLSIGYSARLSKRLNMEFGLGLGYFGGEYKKYYRCSCDDLFPWVSTHQRKWFGPTKAKISLVWQIGSGYNKNYNKTK